MAVGGVGGRGYCTITEEGKTNGATSGPMTNKTAQRQSGLQRLKDDEKRRSGSTLVSFPAEDS